MIDFSYKYDIMYSKDGNESHLKTFFEETTMNIKTVLFCAIIWLTLNFLLVYGRSLVSRKGSERLKMYGKAAKSLVAAVIMGCVGIWATSQPWFGINLPNTASFGQIMLGLICLLGVLCYGVTMFCAIFGQIMMIVSWAGEDMSVCV